MVRVAILIALMFWSSVVLASPTKKEATAFVKEVEAAVKANKKVLEKGTPDVIREHNKWYKALQSKADALFVDADACSFAINSAASIWSDQLRYSQKPDQLGHQFLQRHQEDYQDNMKLCKQSLRTFKSAVPNRP